MDERTACRLEEHLSARCASLHVPGSVLGVADGGTTRLFPYGIVNVDSGLPVTADTLFQIGSITKVLTAVLVLQLVDDGLVELDAPVAAYLPEAGFGDSSCTVRQLLTHTSGVDGDFVEDFGRGNDAIAVRRGLRRAAADRTTRPALLVLQRRVRRPRPLGRGAARPAVPRRARRAPLRSGGTGGYRGAA